VNLALTERVTGRRDRHGMECQVQVREQCNSVAGAVPCLLTELCRAGPGISDRPDEQKRPARSESHPLKGGSAFVVS
jgi:hypothetical protein